MLEGEKIKGKKNDLKAKLLNEEKMKMSFKPIISEKSKFIASRANQEKKCEYSENSIRNDNFSRLYEDAIKRKKQKDKIDKECIKKQSKVKYHKQNPSKPLKFFSPYREQKNYIQNRIFNNKQLDDKLDTTFKPHICSKALSINRNKNNLPIGEYLYQKHILINEKLEKASQEQEIRIEENLNKSFIQKKSIQMIEKMKIDSFIHIFNKLDGKSIGRISSKSINPNSIII